MPALKHIHSYVRMKKNYYKCNHPDCTHFANKDLLLGKRAECSSCMRVFILDSYQLKLKTPKCPNCATHPKYKIRPLASKIMDEIIDEGLVDIGEFL